MGARGRLTEVWTLGGHRRFLEREVRSQLSSTGSVEHPSSRETPADA
jgi:hypothetical protein